MHIPLTLLAVTGLVLSTPVAINSESQTIGHLPSSVNMYKSELPRAFSVPSIPAVVHQKRDGRWPWQKEQDVIGKYPDGRLKCRIVSMTGGHNEGPCPKILPQDQIAEILHAEWCKNNCCKKNGEPCGKDFGVKFGEDDDNNVRLKVGGEAEGKHDESS